MKQIKLSTGTLLVFKVPPNKDAKEFLSEWFPDELRQYKWPGWFDEEFQLLGHPSEITGEVWGKVVDSLVFNCGNLHTCYEYYRDYTNQQQTSPGYNLKTPLQSGLSLCAAHGIKETDVLLFKAKNI